MAMPHRAQRVVLLRLDLPGERLRCPDLGRSRGQGSVIPLVGTHGSSGSSWTGIGERARERCIRVEGDDTIVGVVQELVEDRLGILRIGRDGPFAAWATAAGRWEPVDEGTSPLEVKVTGFAVQAPVAIMRF